MNKLIILVILIAIGVAIYLIIEFKVKKWKCTEGKCEKVIGGDFSSLEKCKELCKIKQEYTSRKKHDQRLIRKARRDERKERKKVRWASNLVQFEQD